MKKFWIQVIILVGVIFGALYLAYNQEIVEEFFPLNKNLVQKQLRVSEAIVTVELADTPAKRSKGLSGRDSLASDAGMLFIFPEVKKPRFWMKGMKFPLDLIFIQEGRVVDSLAHVPPPVPHQKDEDLPFYQPVVPIDMVLEVNSGFIETHNIKVGDRVFLIESQ